MGVCAVKVMLCKGEISMKHILYKIIKIFFIILMSVDMLMVLIVLLYYNTMDIAIIICNNPILDFLEYVYDCGGFLVAAPIPIVNIIFANADRRAIKNSKDEVPAKIKKRCKAYLTVSLISFVVQFAGFIYMSRVVLA